MVKNLIFATNNAHKMQEASAILQGVAALSTPAQHGMADDIPETQPTIEGNAMQKARYIYERLRHDCFADDTGLEVDALCGAPGVHSARYAGIQKDMAANKLLLLRSMQNAHSRKARFRTAIALIVGGREYLFEGIVNGSIAMQEAGGEGFGYDSLFLPDGYSMTFAQMPAQQKNAISHRAIALTKMKEWLTMNF
jgi:XTP/dITP diphosphohydrolase